MGERIPYLILPVRQLSCEPFGIRRSAASEPSGKTPGPSRSDHCAEAPRASCRARRRARLIEPPAEATHEPAVGQATGPASNHPPRRQERAVGQDAGPTWNHPPKRYTREPSGKMPGPYQSGPSAEAPRASRRARRLARLDPTIAPKRRERAAGQDAVLVSSNHPPKRYTSELSGKPPGPPRITRRSDTSEPSGKMPGPPGTIRRSDTSQPSGKMPGPSQSGRSAEAPRASRWAIRRARLDPTIAPKRRV